MPNLKTRFIPDKAKTSPAKKVTRWFNISHIFNHIHASVQKSGRGHILPVPDFYEGERLKKEKQSARELEND